MACMDAFLSKNKDLIVKCERIPTEVWINENNNIYIQKQIPIVDLFENGFYEFEIERNYLNLIVNL